MSSYVGLNRRQGGERRIFDTHPSLSTRGVDSRRRGANAYFYVMGDGGIDSFAVACLIILALIVMLVTG